MCGVILLDAGQHGALTPDNYTALCAQVGGRGPHSHGWALLDDKWKWHLHYGQGPIGNIPDGTWRMALGHSRLATSGASAGTLPQPEHGQPIHHHNLLVAHNGTLKHLASPNFPSDSHHAAHQLHDGREATDVFTCPDNSPQAVIIVNSTVGTATTLRSGQHGGHPLFHTTQDGVRIIASTPPSTTSELIPEGITQWTTT